MSPDIPDSERRPLLSRTSTAYESEAQSVQNVVPLSMYRGVAIGASMFVLIFSMTANVSLMTTIQSPIAEELNASSEVTWFNSSLLIAVTSLTPISGKLCQIFSPQGYLLLSSIVLCIGLFLTSQARNTHAFLGGRAMCGVGAAAITPVAFILVTKLTSPKKRGLFFGCINTGYTTGLACGAIIAGALEPVVGWRTIFWMQIPVVLAAALTAFWMIPPREKQLNREDFSIMQKLRRIDYFGVITLLFTLVLLLYTLSAPHIDLRALGLSFGMLCLFVFVEFHWAQDPIVPPYIMKSRANLFSGVATVGIMTARWGILFYTPVYAIAVRGWNKSAAGALLIPTNLGFALGGILAGYFHIRRTGSFYIPTLTCYGLFAAIQLGVSMLVTPDSPLWHFIVGLFLNGFVVGGLLNYSLAHLLHMTNAADHIIVIPFNATFRSFSGSFGSAIAGGYFLRHLSHNLHRGFQLIGMSHSSELIRRLIGSPLLVQILEGKQRQVAISSYSSALQATFLAGVGLALLMMIIQAFVGWSGPTDEGDKSAVVSNDEILRITSREQSAT